MWMCVYMHTHVCYVPMLEPKWSVRVYIHTYIYIRNVQKNWKTVKTDQTESHRAIFWDEWSDTVWEILKLCDLQFEDFSVRFKIKPP